MVDSPVFRAFAASERPSQSYWLVATSAGEVGINISADRLITELETLDHLLQRFGRLNRFDETDGEAYVLVGSTDAKEPDKQETIAFLRSLPAKGDDSYDISPVALFGRDLPTEACSEPPPQAQLHDFLIEVWSQTSLGKHPARPSVEPWLHGKQDEYPETYVAWREDVRYLVKGGFDDEQRGEVLEKYRLLAHEQLREPTTKLFEKLQELCANSQGDLQVLRRKSDGSVDVFNLHELARANTDRDRRNAMQKIAFCELVLPTGCGTLENGMFSPKVAAETICDDPPADITQVLEKTTASLDVSAFQIVRDDEKVAYVEVRCCFRATQNSEGAWSLHRLGGVPGEQYQTQPLPNLKLPTLRGFAAEHGWRFLTSVEADPEADKEGKSEVLLYFGKANHRAASDEVLLLERHLDDVSILACDLATKLDLEPAVLEALQLAGSFHDLGKGEDIWQTAAGNIKQVGELTRPPSVAKPIAKMRGRDLGGFRHELASLRYAEDKLGRLNLSRQSRDLVLHLIAAHHGHARPRFEKKAYDRNHLTTSARLALDTAQRFALLEDGYGAWGLAYLESILRAADGIASAASAAGEQAMNG
jgi:CRISPR-associated endonuclease/helicase Cas3